MKKITVLFLLATMFVINTKAQTKSGILKKDHYGSFTGDDWEDFLAGRRAADFEKKSNVKLQSYLDNQVAPFVKDQLKEPTIASAVANSTVVSFPADADVYTVTTDGTWITRKAYPGEKGFFHTATGMYWISFSCGNLTAFGPGPTKPEVPAYVGNNKPATPATTVTPNTPGINISLNTNSNPTQNQELSWRAGKVVYDEGRMDYRMALYDAMTFEQMQSKILIEMQNSKQCCNTGGMNQVNTVAPPPTMYTQPVTAMYTQPQQNVVYVDEEKTPFGQTFGGQLLANTGGHVAGTYIVRGIDALFGNNRGQNQTIRYNNNFNTTVRDFQGSGDQNFRLSGVSSTPNLVTGGLIYSNVF